MGQRIRGGKQRPCTQAKQDRESIHCFPWLGSGSATPKRAGPCTDDLGRQTLSLQTCPSSSFIVAQDKMMFLEVQSFLQNHVSTDVWYGYWTKREFEKCAHAGPGTITGSSPACVSAVALSWLSHTSPTWCGKWICMEWMILSFCFLHPRNPSSRINFITQP